MGDDWQSDTHNDAGPSRDREKPRPRRMYEGSNHTPHEMSVCPRVLMHPGANTIEYSSVAKAQSNWSKECAHAEWMGFASATMASKRFSAICITSFKVTRISRRSEPSTRRQPSARS